MTTAPAAATAAPRPAPRPMTLPPGKLKTDATKVWKAWINPGTTIEDVLRPNFWAHNTTRAGVGDEIKVFAPDGTFYMHLVVLSKTVSTLSVRPLMGWAPSEDEAKEAETNEAGAADLYEIKWGGNKDRFRIIDKATMNVVEAGFGSKADAAARAVELRRKVTALQTAA